MFPKFNNIPSQSSFVINKFKGINVTESYESGEIVECNNVASASYPALCSRNKRSVFSSCDGIINGIGSFDGVFYTYYLPQTKSLFLHYKNNDYEFTDCSNCDNPSAKRRFATLENCIVIVPDNIMFFTDSLKFESIDIYRECKFADATEKFKHETGGGTAVDPQSYAKRGYVHSNGIRAYSVTYMQSGLQYDFYFMAFTSSVKKGDVLTIKMDVHSDSASDVNHYTEYVKKMKEGVVAKVKDIKKTKHRTPKGVIEEVTELIFDDNAIDTGGYNDVYFSDIIIEKKMPKADSIASFNNRVWAVSGNKVHASKLGDASEWNDFSVDSYGTLPASCFSASAGSDGDFTAITPHGNYIYAFKQNHIHKIYGDTPDEFTISGMDAPGALAPDTVCVCGVNLMYVSNGGVCVLRDGYPKVVSKKIGDVSAVCGGSYKGKYYLICQNTDSRSLYIYDSDHDLWTRENCSADTDNLCCDGNNIYCSSGGNVICLSSDEGDEYEKNISWNFRLKFDVGHFSPATSIRAVATVKLKKDASFTVRAVYDDDTRGALCGFCYDETPNGCADIRVPIKRDLSFYLDFKGVGHFTLKRLKINYYKSDIE